MELRRHWDLRKVMTLVYLVALVIYLVVGLAPAEAAQYVVADTLEIESIGLTSDVTELNLVEHRLDTPEEIVGSYSRWPSKTLLIGHAGTVFQDLNLVSVGDTIKYGGAIYKVSQIELYRKEDVDMEAVLAPAPRRTLSIMTCAGEVRGLDASHRLILTAVAV